MKLRLRLFWLFLSSFWRPSLGLLDESVLDLQVLPNDVDVSKISNDRFFALMDLGRMDIAFRGGLLRAMFKNKWIPVATLNTIRYRYPLKVFQKYQLKTQIIWWDDKTGYFRQIFERKGRVVASGYVCATFLGPGGTVAPEDIFNAIGHTLEKPDEPEIVKSLKELESRVRESQQEDSAKAI